MKNIMGDKEFLMKTRGIAAGLLAVVLFAFAAPQAAFAKKQKLGQAEALKFFDYMEKSGADSSEVKRALTMMKTQLEKAKKTSKQVFELLEAAQPYYETVSNLLTVVDLFGKWHAAGKGTPNGTKELNKAADVMFDSIEFATGFLPGAYYYKAITQAGRAALRLQNLHFGRERYDVRYTDWEMGLFPAGDHKQGVNGHGLNGVGTGWAFDSDYIDFSRAWFSLAWKTGMKSSDETAILQEISRYIGAHEYAKRAGVMK
jgi:hypothetical protein